MESEKPPNIPLWCLLAWMSGDIGRAWADCQVAISLKNMRTKGIWKRPLSTEDLKQRGQNRIQTSLAVSLYK